MTTFTKQIGGQHGSKNSLDASIYRVCHPCAFGHHYGTVDWLGNCNGDTHEKSGAAKRWTIDIVGYIIGMLFGGVCLLIPIFIIAFIISLFVH